MEERLILTAVLLAACIASLVYRSAAGRDGGRFNASAAVALLSGLALQIEVFPITASAVAAFLTLVLAPQPVARVAMGGGRGARLATRVIPWLWWGPGGRALQAAARSHTLALTGRIDDAAALLDHVDVKAIPRTARAAVGAARASVSLHRRDWNAVLHLADTFAPPGDPVQLLAARAAAELGRPAAGLRRAARALCAAPGTWEPYSLAAAELAAAASAGDSELLERALLRPSGRALEAALPGSADYWRGRCHLSVGARAEAQTALHRSLSAMPEGQARARSAVQRAIDGTLGHIPAITLDGYREARAAFERLLVAMTPWTRFIGGTGAIPVTWAIILVSAALLSPLYMGSDATWIALIDDFANSGDRVLLHDEHWRLVTALFLHANIFHFGFNAAALLLFGGPVERLWGPFVMALVFLVTGLLGHLTSAVWHGMDSRAVGASTGVYGIVAVYIIALLQLPGDALRRYRLRRASLLLVVVGFDVLFSLVEPRIDTAGHVGGFLAGVVFAGAVFALRRLVHAPVALIGPEGPPPPDAASF